MVLIYFTKGRVVPAQMMHRIDARRVLPGRTPTASTGEKAPTPEALIHSQFRRFVSCPIRNVHLGRATLRRDEIRAVGVHGVALFRSGADTMQAHHAASADGYRS